MVPHLSSFFLSVLAPIAGDDERTGHHVVHVFELQHGRGLQWTREHADELATMAYGPGYDALMVHEAHPYPVTPAERAYRQTRAYTARRADHAAIEAATGFDARRVCR